MKVKFKFEGPVKNSFEPTIMFDDRDGYDVVYESVINYIRNCTRDGYIYINGQILDGEMEGRNLIDLIDIRPALENESDNVNHPSHYNSGKFEVIDIIDEFGKEYEGADGFCFGNIVKYVLRAKHKNGVEDLKKARWYLDRLIMHWED
jgi:hypothetical protein